MAIDVTINRRYKFVRGCLLISPKNVVERRFNAIPG